MEKAIWLDPTDPMFKAYYAQLLNLWGRPDEALPNFRFAIDHGMANSTTYFGLCSTYLLLERNDDADQAFQEATRLYPKSVFLQTAYASFLKRHGEPEEAQKRFEIAKSVNEKQAISWQLAHDQGLAELSRLSLQDGNYLKVEELLPLNGPMALANYQQLSKAP
jgi:predicted Zn-dependent protease